ncbi:MAG TPA: PDZ domain-containing protein, partial [Candidatus Dormibacteraeota bacterium]|nr:PDZ domain-containing protein [Candidatus Dormibacteraeota bacterium]
MACFEYSHAGLLTVMKQNLRVSLGAVVLALATLAAVIFALLNFDQRTRYEQVYDGVTWFDTDHGIQARDVAPNSPASHTAIHPGDVLLEFNGASISRAAEVARRLDHAGRWSLVRYKLLRNGEEFETPLVTAPAEKPLAAENYLRAVGLLYLFIGLFIFVRRWNAPRAVHFYIFCLASFILWSFHYSGKLDTFDWEIYWSEIVVRLLVPALLLHFALVFPSRTESKIRTTAKVLAVYLVPFALLLVHAST